MVQEALDSDTIHLHGLMFSMGKGQLEKYYPDKGVFKVIAERPAKPIEQS